MIDKTVALTIVYSLIGIGTLLIISHLVTSVRSGVLSIFWRAKDLSKDDVLNYKQKTITSRKYALLGGGLVFVGILFFIIFSIINSHNRL